MSSELWNSDWIFPKGYVVSLVMTLPILTWLSERWVCQNCCLLVLCSGVWLVFLGSYSGFLQEAKGQQDTAQDKESLGCCQHPNASCAWETPGWQCCWCAACRLPLGPVAEHFDKQPVGWSGGTADALGSGGFSDPSDFLIGRVAKTLLWQTARTSGLGILLLWKACFQVWVKHQGSSVTMHCQGCVLPGSHSELSVSWMVPGGFLVLVFCFSKGSLFYNFVNIFSDGWEGGLQSEWITR